MVLEYANRILQRNERLKKQRKRIETQNKRRSISGIDKSRGIPERLEIEQLRIYNQAKRILKQRTEDAQRAQEAIARGIRLTGRDTLERRQEAKSLRWKLKFDRRKAKWDASAKRFGK